MIPALAIGGGLLLVVIIHAWWSQVQIRDAERRAADARVDAATKAGQLAIVSANEKTERARGDREKERADALDDVLEQVATDGDADGARERVLARLARRTAATNPDPNPANGGDAGPVRDSKPHPGVGGLDGDALETPGS